MWTGLAIFNPITIVVPLAAGSGMDTLVRIYADKLQQSLGQPVIVENKPGAGGTIGGTEVVRSAPDGYTLMLSNSTPLSIASAPRFGNARRLCGEAKVII